MAIEADYEDALKDLRKFGFYLRQNGLESVHEKNIAVDISGYSWWNGSQHVIALSTFAALPCGWVSRSREASGEKEGGPWHCRTLTSRFAVQPECECRLLPLRQNKRKVIAEPDVGI